MFQSQTYQKQKKMYHKNILLSIFYLFLLNARKTIECSDIFNEELVIKPLATGHINTYFQFTTSWQIKNNESREYLVVYNPLMGA